MRNSKKLLKYGGMFLYILFIFLSYLFNFTPGREIAGNFTDFTIDMVKIIPCAFILISLFEVWVKKETVEKHLGRESGILSYFWMILLAGTTIGALYVALPAAYSLYKKGARYSVIFTYIGAATICRIPMTIFEASFMGYKFTLIRLIVSLPLIIFTSKLFETYLEKRNFKMSNNL